MDSRSESLSDPARFLADPRRKPADAGRLPVEEESLLRPGYDSSESLSWLLRLLVVPVLDVDLYNAEQTLIYRGLNETIKQTKQTPVLQQLRKKMECDRLEKHCEEATKPHC